MEPHTLALDLQTRITLTTGVALLTCALAVVGVHAYAAGRAQRQALVDRLTSTGPLTGPAAADAASRTWTAVCAVRSRASGWSCAWRQPAWTSPRASSSSTCWRRWRACG